MAEARAAKQDVALEVRPTVFVGLGGTGMEILLRLRRRILQAEWNGDRIGSMAEFPLAAFLYFDTDSAAPREAGRAAVVDPMAQVVAFGEGDKLQAKVDVAYYQRNRSNRPEIADWLPSRDLAALDVDKGAGQVRAISRLLFFDKFDQFKRMLQAKIAAVSDNVSTQRALEKLGIVTQREVRVVVVGSLAGGTGSGAFIDTGLAISSLQPKPDQIDLFLVLPGGYTAANRDRVFANSYAALSELEHVMRPSPNPPYVAAWTSVDKPTADRPYKDVYLFDTQNINRDSTGRIDDLFDMMADILFEDFGSSDFARRKRSISVNQEQHKLSMFYPPIDGDARQGALAYSRGYSAIGQSIVATTGSLRLEEAVCDASQTMLRAFFGVWNSGSGKSPASKDRDVFIRDKLLLAPQIFDDFPEYVTPRPAAIGGYSIIDSLLVSDDLKSIHGRLVEDIATEFRTIREQASEVKDWAAQVERVRARYEGEVLSRAGSQSIRKQEVERARVRTLDQLTKDDGSDNSRSIRQGLFDLVDDRVNGGIDFTIALVEQLRDELARDGTGVRARLGDAAQQFRAVADTIMNDHLVGSLKKLESAAKRNFLGRADRGAAEEYMKQFEADLGSALKYWLRATAATEAQKLLDDVASYLGERLAADDNGRVVWTGLLRELDDGRQSVQAVLEMIGAEGDRVRDAINRKEAGMYIIVGQGTPPIAPERTIDEPKAWSEELFTSFGGCRKLLPMLRNDEERLKVINQLRSIAKGHFAGEEEKMPSIVDALMLLDEAEKVKIIKRMMERSMPWFPSVFDNFKPNGDQFKMIIASPHSEMVKRELLPIITTARPSKYLGADPTIEESGVKGRIICYCELSGFPLDAVAPLRDEWRKSYEKILNSRDPIPLHNHQDYLRFPMPVVPTPDELAQQKKSLTFFLRAVLCNILSRGANNADSETYRNDPRYYVDMSRHDLQSVGSERKIKAKGFDASHLGRVKVLIDQFETRLSAVQLIALSAFARWTARHAYAPPREENVETQTRIPGLGYRVANALADEYMLMAKRSSGFATLPDNAEKMLSTLFDRVDNFTVDIPNSLDDLDHREANRDLDDNVANRGRNKRQLDAAKFIDATLTDIAMGKGSAGPALVSVAEPQPTEFSAMPPPLGANAIAYYVLINGNGAGPFEWSSLEKMVQSGQLTATSQVCNARGGTSWGPASAEGALLPLLGQSGFTPPPPIP
jgi:Tubulin like